MNSELIKSIREHHTERFRVSPSVAAYAPGRVEVLGNHTDYNEGFVLSAAIDLGIAAAFSRRADGQCELLALDAGEEATARLPLSGPIEKPMWANYILGVLSGLASLHPKAFGGGFNVTFSGDIPLGAGLSSSAALEISCALGLCALACVELNPLEIAKICQAAEHEFVGTKCGLLDQISSLFGKNNALVFCDFRSLEVETSPLGADSCFLIANTRVSHNLVESEYNERRARCEQAAAFLASKLDHPVKALRDVSPGELKRFIAEMDPVTARRAAHVVGENHRVLKGRKLLARDDVAAFGRLMFESHESSRLNFENSCVELDSIVEDAQKLKAIAGARLSGGGFGGSVVMLVHPAHASSAAETISNGYKEKFGTSCDIRIIKPSNGARVIETKHRD